MGSRSSEPFGSLAWIFPYLGHTVSCFHTSFSSTFIVVALNVLADPRSGKPVRPRNWSQASRWEPRWLSGTRSTGYNKCVLKTLYVVFLVQDTTLQPAPPFPLSSPGLFPLLLWGRLCAADGAGWDSAPACRRVVPATERADRQTLPRAKDGATKGQRCWGSTGRAHGVGAWECWWRSGPSRSFQAKEERVQKHRYKGAMKARCHGASPWGSVGERIRKSQHEIKRRLLPQRKVMTDLDSILKSRDIANKSPSSQGYGFSSSHVWMWELDFKESWAPSNWCFWIVY